MTDDSNIILRWEIDNATATLATGRAESGVFNEGGFKWTAAMNRRVVPSSSPRAVFTLRCAVDHNGPWKCEVDVGLYLRYHSGTFHKSFETNRVCFDENDGSWEHEFQFGWSRFLDSSGYNKDDKVAAEFRLHIISSERGHSIVEPSMFDSPNRMSDVILKIEEKKMHVCKQFLAVHSPVFEAMFFGNFVENVMEEVQMKDVVYEEFLDLLHLIYPTASKITDRTVQHIIKLADQFQMENLFNESTTYLTESNGFDVMKKLFVADRYNILTLRDHCLNSFTSVMELKEKLQSSPDYANFSKEMKAAISDRIMNL